jgi:hypothetical protein
MSVTSFWNTGIEQCPEDEQARLVCTFEKYSHSLTRTAIPSLYLAPCRLIVLVHTQHWEMLDAGFQVVCCKVLGNVHFRTDQWSTSEAQSRSRPIIVLLPQSSDLERASAWFPVLRCLLNKQTCFSSVAECMACWKSLQTLQRTPGEFKLVRFCSNFIVPNRPYDICVLSAFV